MSKLFAANSCQRAASAHELTSVSACWLLHAGKRHRCCSSCVHKSLALPALAPLVSAVGGFIGPFLLGRLSDRADGGFTAAMVMLACFLGASGTCLLLFPAPGQRPGEGAGDKEQAANGGGGHTHLPAALTVDDADQEEGEAVPLAGHTSNGEHAGWGSAAAGPDEHSQRRQQQRELQRERLRGVGSGSSRSLSQKGSRGDLEFQPILQGRSDRSS